MQELWDTKMFRLSPEILAKILKLLGKHKNSNEQSLKLSAVMRGNAYRRYQGVRERNKRLLGILEIFEGKILCL